MRIFINFWKLEIENSILHVFIFFYKLSFENSFCFLSILSYQTSFLVSKIENCFWKQKIKGKNSYQIYSKYFLLSHFSIFSISISIIPLFHSTLSTKWTLKEKNLKINTQLTPLKTKLSNGSYVSDFVIVELENISIKMQI